MRGASARLCAALILFGGLAPAIAFAQSKPLFAAVRSGTAAQVAGAIRRGASPNAIFSDGETPLAAAAMTNPNPAVITILVKAGARIDARDSTGMTPLMWAAAENRNPEVTDALLAAGADPNARNVIGLTPLMFAAKDGTNPAVARRLLAAGARVDARDISGLTALMYAASRNDSPALITDLLAAGANPNLRDDAGRTALVLAVANGALSGSAAIAELREAAATALAESKSPAAAEGRSGPSGEPSTTAPAERDRRHGQPTTASSRLAASPAKGAIERGRPKGATAVSVLLPLTTIAPYAGGGTGGSGAPAPATALSLSDPVGLALDSRGDLFIADAGDNVIREVTPNGTMTTVAGDGTEGYAGDGGPATRAELDWPQGVAVDARGDLFIADSNNNVVREVSPDGRIRTVAGTGKPGYSGDGGPAVDARLDFPTGIAVDAAGDLYIADTYNNVVRKVADNGVISTVAGDGYTGAQGFGGYRGDGGPATSARLSWPRGVAVADDGDLYIADSANNCIRRVNTKGIITTVAGSAVQGFSGDGGPARSSELTWPTAIAVGKGGTLYIADTGNQRVRKVTTQGIISTIAGDGVQGESGNGGPPRFAQLGDPSGLALGRDGRIYISEGWNNGVRLVAPPSGPTSRGVLVFRVVPTAPSRAPVTIALSGPNLRQSYRGIDDTVVTGDLDPGVYDFHAAFGDDAGVGFAGTARVEAGKETLLTFELGYSSEKNLAIARERESLVHERARIGLQLPALRAEHARNVRAGLSLYAIGMLTAGASALLSFDGSPLQASGITINKTALLVTGGIGLGLLVTGLIVPLTFPSQAYIDQEERSELELDHQLRQLRATEVAGERPARLASRGLDTAAPVAGADSSTATQPHL